MARVHKLQPEPDNESEKVREAMLVVVTEDGSIIQYKVLPYQQSTDTRASDLCDGINRHLEFTAKRVRLIPHD